MKHSYTFDELATTWKTVKPKDDWKRPIHLLLPLTVDRDLIGETIKKFTGASAVFLTTTEGLMVTSEGYNPKGYDA